MSTPDTRTALLAEAETLVRTVGYTAFSYADLSARVGIRKASVHHHFPTKEALGNALIDAYLDRFVADLERLAGRRLQTKNKLLAYGDFFSGGMRDGLMPLCGALAAGAADLPISMQGRVKRFFGIHLAWLEGILAHGIDAGEIPQSLKPERVALVILSTLQGASLVAWALKDPKLIRPALRDVADALIP
ncbi:TetR/AcrR family transcriptional regulator [Hyphomicrobium sp.]|uniref:TetR/AcrR family transcriptional regulator n=1 Tax=Hyphomicrobium sp. TaxID=82 RepID=UPI002FDD5C45